MKNILIPTDFSATAKNAAIYGLQLAGKLGIKKVILFNAFQVPMILEPMAVDPSLQVIDEKEIKETITNDLQQLKTSLQEYCPQGCEIDTSCEMMLLQDGLNDVCLRNNCGLIVMGITGGGLIAETIIGSNTISVSKHTNLPVIIVQADVQFKQIKNVLLSSDFKDVLLTTPIKFIKEFITATGAGLHVIHVANQNASPNPDTRYETMVLDIFLSDLKPSYHFVHNEDFISGINQFVTDNQIDILITIPKKHGLFEKLFSKSHTKQLAFHSKVPVMVIHE